MRRFIWSFACIDLDVYYTWLIFDKVILFILGPTNETSWTAHVDIFYCYVFCQTAQNWKRQWNYKAW